MSILRRYRRLVIILTSVLVFILPGFPAPLLSSPYHHLCPGDHCDFIIIGWSKGGNRLAYAWFQYSTVVSNQSRLMVTVRDLVSDETLLEEEIAWDQGNTGIGDVTPPPLTVNEAWQREGKRISETLQRYGVQVAVDKTVFYLSGNDDSDFNIEFKKSDKVTSGVGLFVASVSHGEELIWSSADNEIEMFSIVGYVLNPDRTMMGVILHGKDRLPPYSHVRVVGGHVSRQILPVKTDTVR
ncbi:MAG: hypothetical protein HKM93_16965 [Desulfobacteraceae bacterium]|nr:hypothetical protein [Desulfobacteraceae bacterium]